MNRYRKIKAHRIPRFERCGDYFIIVKPDENGVCLAHTVMKNPK